MRWASAVSINPSLRAALDEVSATVRERLGGARPDLVLVFASPHHRGALDELPELLHARLGPTALVGCTAAGVIGGGQELEERVAITLVGATLPGVSLRTFHVDEEDLPDLDGGPQAWLDLVGAPPSPTPHLILLADGSTFDPRALLEGLDFAYPESTKTGGLASGRRGDPLFLDRRVVKGGAIGVALSGDVRVDAVVAQGCRPIGPVMTVARCREHVLEQVSLAPGAASAEFDGAAWKEERPPLEVLTQIYETLPPDEQEQLQHSLHLGIAATELGAEGAPREFLVRNVMGADPERGILAVGALLRRGQTVQFHLRDARAAAEDLDLQLGRYASTRPAIPPAGALLFSCTGRGKHLYGHADHDSNAMKKVLGDVPLGGFFCGGEVGPVAGATHLHGYTSAFALFRPGS
jgi:small ligand-binding sensory domain FIST